MDQDIVSEVEAIFNPRSVAMVGVSERPDTLAYRWLQTLQDSGFPRLYPVNPKGGEVLGLRVYRSIRDIPDVVDLAIVLVPREVVPRIARDCARKGTKAMVLYTSGFGETGADGRELEKEIVRIAHEGGTRVIGPSCLGPYNPEANLITQYVFPREAGSVGVISHSGFVFNFLVMCVTATGIGPSRGVSCGSDCDLTCVDFLEYLGHDPQTKIIVAYLEGIGDGKRFLRLAREVSKNKPIIVLKGGDTEIGEQASASHTGTLAVPSAVWRAMCGQAGIVSVDSFEQMIDVLKALYHLPRSAGRRVGIITSPGGLAVTTADACSKLGLQVPQLSSGSQRELADLVGTLGTNLRNPVDLGPMGALAIDRYLKEALRIVARDPSIDMVLTGIIGPPIFDDSRDREVADMLLAEVTAAGKPAVFSGASLQGWDRGELKFLAQSNVPVYPEGRRAAYALSKLAEYSEYVSSVEA